MHAQFRYILMHVELYIIMLSWYALCMHRLACLRLSLCLTSNLVKEPFMKICNCFISLPRTLVTEIDVRSAALTQIEEVYERWASTSPGGFPILSRLSPHYESMDTHSALGAKNSKHRTITFLFRHLRVRSNELWRAIQSKHARKNDIERIINCSEGNHLLNEWIVGTSRSQVTFTKPHESEDEIVIITCLSPCRTRFFFTILGVDDKDHSLDIVVPDWSTIFCSRLILHAECLHNGHPEEDGFLLLLIQAPNLITIYSIPPTLKTQGLDTPNGPLFRTSIPGVIRAGHDFQLCGCEWWPSQRNFPLTIFSPIMRPHSFSVLFLQGAHVLALKTALLWIIEVPFRPKSNEVQEMSSSAYLRGPYVLHGLPLGVLHLVASFCVKSDLQTDIDESRKEPTHLILAFTVLQHSYTLAAEDNTNAQGTADSSNSYLQGVTLYIPGLDEWTDVQYIPRYPTPQPEINANKTLNSTMQHVYACINAEVSKVLNYIKTSGSH